MLDLLFSTQLSHINVTRNNSFYKAITLSVQGGRFSWFT
jgi:hypothetical protein